MKILISAAGTSDPVRGDHDGALLHVLRHYRPERVYLLLTSQMTEFEANDQRFVKMRNFVLKNWNGYAFELTMIDMNLKDPSDQDACSDAMDSTIENIKAKEKDSTILYNLSSGTPQMKTVLLMNLLDTRYHNIGIQVKNPEKGAGTTDRVTKGYPIEESLLLNLDEEDNSPNRCVEPKMLYLQRKRQEGQTASLLKRFDYAAINDLDQISLSVKPLVKHLMYRSVLKMEEAKRYAGIAKKLDPELPSLFPYFKQQPESGKKKRLETLIEYYLSLKNLQQAQDYTEFILRLNPFFTALETEALIQFLPYGLDQIADHTRAGWKIARFKFVRKDPDFSHFVDEEMRKDGYAGYMDRTSFNQYLLKTMLQYFHKISSSAEKLIDNVFELNQQKRNPAAHDLVCVTDEDLKDACGMTGRMIILKTEKLMLELFPEINKTIFSIYSQCNRYILDHLD